MILALTIGLGVLFPGGSAMGQTQLPGKATVRFVSGDVTYSRKGAPFIPLKVNTALIMGDVVKTGEGAKADLALGRNNGAVQVTPGSILAFDRLVYSTAGEETIHDTQLNLSKGVLFGRVNKMSPQSRYEVKTPRCVAGIRGTLYSVNAESGLVTVLEGTVIVVVVQPSTTPGAPPVVQTFTVGPGQTFDPSGPAGGPVRQALPGEGPQMPEIPETTPETPVLMFLPAETKPADPKPADPKPTEGNEHTPPSQYTPGQ